ncbi:MAG: hypothetical protein KDD36_06890 [Flavobacteriales bacterium]|nr:hypothetical protein [Flavobacteriales bacterium]
MKKYGVYNIPIRLFILIGFVIHAVVFVYACYEVNLYYGWPLSDATDYLRLAENLRVHGLMYCGDLNEPFLPALVSRRPPFYGLFITMLRFISSSPYLILAAQNLLGLLNVWLMLLCVRKITGVKQFPWWLLVILWFPSQYILANVIMSEVFFQTWLIWGLYHGICFLKTSSTRHLVIWQLLIVAAMLTKPIMYLFVIPMMVLLAVMIWKKKVRPVVMVVILIPLSGIISLSAYNFKQTGYFHFSSIQNFNLLNYNTAYTLREALGPDPADSVMNELHNRLDTIPDFATRERATQRICTANLYRYKWTYLRMEVQGIIKFFIDPGRWDLYDFMGMRPQNDHGMAWHFRREGVSGWWRYVSSFPLLVWMYMIITYAVNFWIIFGLMRFTRATDISPWIRVCLVTVTLYFASITGPLASGRFRVPVYPVIACMVLSGYVSRMKPKQLNAL